VGFFSKLFGGERQGKGASDLSALAVDVHSHLLPGLDDGAQTMEHTLAMIRGMHGLGINHFITTPHVMSDAYRNTPATILGALDKVRAKLAEEQIAVTIEAAAEYYIDEAFEEMLEQGTPLLTFGGKAKYLLFETSYMNKPMSLESTIFNLLAADYKPVLAHPERYTYFWGDGTLESLSKLYELGALFQVNLGSFAGSYSKRAGSIAKQLLDADLIDFVGSDLHREQQVDSLRRALEAGGQPLKQLLESGRLHNHRLSQNQHP
jgi:tyrosine-protein phosphatase YwqE